MLSSAAVLVFLMYLIVTVVAVLGMRLQDYLPLLAAMVFLL
jgi:hypothetical protein